MFEKEQYISIEKVDLVDQTYRVSTDNNISKILDSIQINGLINPVLIKRHNAKFIVISGYKRAKAVKEIGIDKIRVRIVKEENSKEETEFFCAKLSVIENAFHRELNLIEQAKAVSLLKKSLSIKEISLNSPFFFNSNLNQKMISRLIIIHSLDNSVHDLILSKKLSMNNALKIMNYETPIFDAFIKIFQKVRMGQNKQSEIIVNFHEIALRDDFPLIKFINSNKVLEIINNDNPDENYKANLLRSYLSKKRFPQLTQAFEDHKKYIRELKLEPGIKIDPPNNFEGEEYSASFKFRNIEEFRKHSDKLVSIYETEAFKKLIK
jgi:ParB family transcriptional regulator, chromosome partitioning protein